MLLNKRIGLLAGLMSVLDEGIPGIGLPELKLGSGLHRRRKKAIVGKKAIAQAKIKEIKDERVRKAKRKAVRKSRKINQRYAKTH
jgi:hypothetical protein